MNLTGKLPYGSGWGYEYALIEYQYDSNTIVGVLLKKNDKQLL